jgi:hypothetical protein
MTTFGKPTPMGLAVREATADDRPALDQFARTTFDERLGQHLSPAEMGAFSGHYLSGSQDGRCFVALADGALVGYAVAASSNNRGSGLDRLYVRDSENSRAVAVALLAVVKAASQQPNWGTEPLEIYDRWGFVDIPALRSCLASPWGSGTVPIPGIAAAF